MGLATANSLAAIESGADEVQCTTGGIGERCGNTSLEEIIALLQLNSVYAKEYRFCADIKHVVENALNIFKYLNKPICPYKPLIGEYAFSSAAGIHQDGIMKSPDTYSFFDPALIGRRLEFVVNKLSSRKLFNV